MSQARNPIAAIDIGTNSAHLVIAEMDQKAGLRVLDTDKVTLRLGQAIDHAGNITADGIFRTVEAINHMKALTKSYRAPIRAVATHATREAQNYRELIDRVRTDTGIEIEIIDGVEEARLVFLGMRYGLPIAGKSCLGVDIGGGSTEIVVAKDDAISYLSSAKLGAVTLTDKYLDVKNPKGKQIEALASHVRSRFAPYVPELKGLAYEKALISSGTAKALATINASLLDGESLSDPNGYVISQEALFRIYKKLIELKTPAKIREATGIDNSRAEIILAGTIVLAEITSLMKVKEWTVTTYGLREGLVADTYFRMHGQSGSLYDHDVQWSSVHEFAERLGINKAHAEHMVKLVTRIHQQIASVVRPEDDEQDQAHDLRLLQVASYLHNAGRFISAPQYHKHSNYLISNSQLPGFTTDERLIMGLVNRYQRKSVPTAGSRPCAQLSPRDLSRLKLLSGILRLAATLDRTRQQRVTDVVVAQTDHKLVFNIAFGEETPDVEMHKAKLEREALERSFGMPVKVVLETK